MKKFSQLNHLTRKDPPLIQIFEVGRPTLIWATPSAGSLDKEHKRGKLCSLPAYPHSQWQVHSFTGIKACFFGISTYTEDQLRRPASWTEQLLDCWTFHR